MISTIQKYPRAFAGALVLHIVLVSFFVFSFDWSKKIDPVAPEVDVVQAVAVNEQQVLAELEKIKADEHKRKSAEERRVRDLEKKADDAKREREKEQARLKEIERQRQEEQERKKQVEAESKKAEEKRKLEEKRAVEEQRKADDARRRAEEERKKAEDARRKAEEAEKKRKDEERRQREAKEKEEMDRIRQQEMQEEERRLKAASDKAKATALQKHMFLVKAQIERHWNKVGLIKGVSCTVQIRLMPTGQVIGVTLKSSSGDSKFDSTVQDAILRAQPLPMPTDSSLMNEFRNIELEFKN